MKFQLSAETLIWMNIDTKNAHIHVAYCMISTLNDFEFMVVIIVYVVLVKFVNNDRTYFIKSNS